MRLIVILTTALLLSQHVFAQTHKNTYTLLADTVKITNPDSAELILENHTQNVSGFLYNTGHGRTIFKRAAVKINDSMYQVGGDTIKLSTAGANAWVQGGNSWGKIGTLGTVDSNYMELIQHGANRLKIFNTGNIGINAEADYGYKLYVGGTGYFTGGISSPNLTIGTGGHTLTGPLNLGLSNIIYGNSITFNTDNALSYTNLSPFIFTSQPPSANSGSGYIRLVTINKLVNQGGAGTAEETGLYVKFTVTGTATDLRAVDAAQGNIAVEAGNVVVGGTTGSTSRIDVTGVNGYSQFRLRTSYTPTSSSDANGNVGDFSRDDNYLYIKTSAGWKRATFSTF